MNAKKIKSTVIASALVGCLAIGGISAYFTDADTATNEFTVGKVEIDLQEPSFAEEYPEVTPGMEIKKDPKIVNTGVNEAYGFLEVKVPYAKVVTAEENGTPEAEAYKEIFTYDINSTWAELDEFKVIVDKDGNVVEESALVDSKDYFVKHIYAYGSETELSVIADKDANGATSTLFDYVKLINLVEGNLEEKDLQIDITAYAIQTSNLKDAVDTDAENINGTNDTTKVPSEVWSIIVNANPSTDAPSGTTEDKKTDVRS